MQASKFVNREIEEKLRRLINGRQFDDASKVFIKYPLDRFAAASLIKHYGDGGNLNHALKLFECLKKKRNPDSGVINSMVNACRTNKQPNLVVSNLELATNIGKFFSYKPNNKAIALVMTACIESEQSNLVVNIWNSLIQFKLPIDAHICTLSLRACSYVPALDTGKQVHNILISQKVKIDSHLRTSLMHMYGRCGRPELAEQFIDTRESTIYEWTALINAYGINGFGNKAIEVYKQALKNNIVPNQVTFLCLLTACSHAGLIEEAHKIYNQMVELNIEPDERHMVNMVDILARAGRLSEAEEWAVKVNNISGWTCILQGCSTYRDLERAEKAFKGATSVDPSDPSPYVLMASIYASFGKWKEREDVRKSIDDLGLKKVPGITWIEVNGYVHQLVMEDEAHPQIEEIHNVLKDLKKKIAATNYEPHTHCVLRGESITEEQKKELLWKHSERLAIGLAILTTPPKSDILMWKNLRMCEDCHEVTKLISQVEQRKINIRDKSRFHHFENGKCSCNDYF